MRPETRVSRLTVMVALLAGAVVGGGSALVGVESSSLSVTIMIAPENKVCPPHGYPPYEERKPDTPPCPELGIADVTELERFVSDKVMCEIPPGVLSIVELNSFLNSYLRTERWEKAEDDRDASVFIFDWGRPQDFVVTFQRISSRKDSREEKLRSDQLPSGKLKSRKLNRERRYIYHERADALAPSNHMTWKLTAGGRELELRTDVTGRRGTKCKRSP